MFPPHATSMTLVNVISFDISGGRRLVADDVIVDAIEPGVVAVPVGIFDKKVAGIFADEVRRDSNVLIEGTGAGR